MKKRIAIIGALALVVFTSHAWTQVLLDSSALKAFVLSSSFWPAVFGGVLVLLSFIAAVVAAYVFHTARLTGRTGSGGQE